MTIETQRQLASAAPRLFDIVIIGGGLSGVFTAHGLAVVSTAKLKWKLLEATDRLGGRLANASHTVDVDMGGAWIWPEHQPFVKKLASDLSLTTFPQPDDPSSARIEGGAHRFVQELYKSILAQTKKECKGEYSENKGDSSVAFHSPVSACNYKKDEGEEAYIEVKTIDGTVYRSRKVVFAIPPKIISESVSFDPPLSAQKRSAMAASRTWMAGVTKVALLYPQRFWDLRTSNMGLPKSATGPAFQVYDCATKDNTTVPAGLTFFAHVSPDSPAQSDDALLAKEVASQMEKSWTRFGLTEQADKVHSYSSFFVHRWPMEAFVSGLESKPLAVHPHPSPVAALSTPEWDGHLLFAGTETDLSSPGVMEGAIGAAKRVLNSLLHP